MPSKLKVLSASQNLDLITSDITFDDGSILLVCTNGEDKEDDKTPLVPITLSQKGKVVFRFEQDKFPIEAAGEYVLVACDHLCREFQLGPNVNWIPETTTAVAGMRSSSNEEQHMEGVRFEAEDLLYIRDLILLKVMEVKIQYHDQPHCAELKELYDTVNARFHRIDTVCKAVYG